MNLTFERHGFRYQVAGAEHDAEIARLLNDNEIPGWVSLSYRTQPGWHRPLFASYRSDTIIGVNPIGRAGGVATRSVHRAFIAGRKQVVGWLSQLRIDKPVRNRPHLLRAGFEAVEQFLHDPAQTPYYFASIIDGNEVARRILEKGLEGFPRFERLFGYRVLAMSATGASNVATATPEELPEIVAFINRQNRHRDLAPVLHAETLLNGEGSGLGADDFIALRIAGKIVAACAVWDQHPYRSIRVAGYRQPLAMLRPLLNVASSVTGLPRLPVPGKLLRQAYLSFPAVSEHHPAMWSALVREAMGVAKTRGATLLAVGFAEGDPAGDLLAEAFRHRVYRSTIYRVSFEGSGQKAMPALENPKVEIGLL